MERRKQNVLLLIATNIIHDRGLMAQRFDEGLHCKSL